MTLRYPLLDFSHFNTTAYQRQICADFYHKKLMKASYVATLFSSIN